MGGQELPRALMHPEYGDATNRPSCSRAGVKTGMPNSGGSRLPRPATQGGILQHVSHHPATHTVGVRTARRQGRSLGLPPAKKKLPRAPQWGAAAGGSYTRKR